MRPVLLSILLLCAGGAHAQTKPNAPAPIRQPGPPQVVTPGTPPSTVVVGGDKENSGPGANTTVARSGTGADTYTTDSAVGGNASQPSRAVPQGSGNSGGDGQ